MESLRKMKLAIKNKTALLLKERCFSKNQVSLIIIAKLNQEIL